MSNMSYCRFENTNGDLMDCQEALEDLVGNGVGKLSPRELAAAKRLLVRCLDLTTLLAEHIGKPIEELEESDLESALDEANDDADEEKG